MAWPINFLNFDDVAQCDYGTLEELKKGHFLILTSKAHHSLTSYYLPCPTLGITSVSLTAHHRPPINPFPREGARNDVAILVVLLPAKHHAVVVVVVVVVLS